MPSRDLRVVLRSAAGDKQLREDRVHDYRGKKFVYFDSVRPGVYALEIRLREFPDPLLRLDGVEIRPGQQDVHPRLKDLNLMGVLHRFVITAVDDRGSVVQPNWPLVAGVTRPGGKRSFVGFAWKEEGACDRECEPPTRRYGHGPVAIVR